VFFLPWCVGSFSGRHVVVGSWVVAGEAAGLCFREDSDRTTTNNSSFVPHYVAGPLPPDPKPAPEYHHHHHGGGLGGSLWRAGGWGGSSPGGGQRAAEAVAAVVNKAKQYTSKMTPRPKAPPGRSPHPTGSSHRGATGMHPTGHHGGAGRAGASG
jgi:hypothetical protein